MQRVTITIDDDLAADLERYMAARGYANRSEAIRDLARSGLQQSSAQAGGPQPCVAALIYVYDHHQRELPKRLTRDFMILRRRRCTFIWITSAAWKSRS
jgi:CopG family nickel-responsive transcriptional regulator